MYIYTSIHDLGHLLLLRLLPLQEAAVLANSPVRLEAGQVRRIRRTEVKIRVWPLPDIRLLRGSCAHINHPFTLNAHPQCPPSYNTIARPLGNIRLPFRPSVCMLYTIQYWYQQYLVKAKQGRVCVQTRGFGWIP